MSDSPLSDEDTAVLEAIGGDPDTIHGNGTDPTEEYVTREEYENLREIVLDLLRWKNNLDLSGTQSLTTLEKYTRMYNNGEHEPLSASDVRAVRIHSNWDTLSHQLPNGYTGVSTRKKSDKEHGPSQLKVDLQHLLDEDLQSTQIHRAMKRTAELSGGSAEPDQYGRMHVVGGLYEFHERTTPDNTDHTTYKVLIQT